MSNVVESRETPILGHTHIRVRDDRCRDHQQSLVLLAGGKFPLVSFEVAHDSIAALSGYNVAKNYWVYQNTGPISPSDSRLGQVKDSVNEQSGVVADSSMQLGQEGSP